jgi:hypothetical protein
VVAGYVIASAFVLSRLIPNVQREYFKSNSARVCARRGCFLLLPIPPLSIDRLLMLQIDTLRAKYEKAEEPIAAERLKSFMEARAASEALDAARKNA